MNDYPRSLINRLIHCYNSKGKQTDQPSADQPPPCDTPPGPGPPNQPTGKNRQTDPPQSNHHQTADQPNSNPTDEAKETITGTSNKQQNYRSVPYIAQLTERLTKMLATDYTHLKFACKHHNTVRQFFTAVKDPTDSKDQTNVIYKIPCGNCKCSYIGMTTNKLCTRLAGHKSNVNKLEQTLKLDTDRTQKLEELKGRTALIEHCINKDHRFNLEGTTIIDRTLQIHTLPFLEMCHIYNTPNTVNRRVDIDGLNTAYAGVLHMMKTNTQKQKRSTTSSPSIAVK